MSVQDDFYKSFYEEAPDMLCSVDPADGRITTCNQRLVDSLGYTRDEIVGQHISFVYDPGCIKQVDRAFESFISTGEATDPHIVLRKKDGERIDVSLRVSSHRDESGNIIASRSAWRDIGAELEVSRLELELKIQKAQKMESLALLAGGIAHDFNNLLVSILGNANMAVSEIAIESPVAEKIQAIETAAKRAADLTKQLLAYSGSESHQKRVFDLSAVVAEMGHLLDVAISKKVVLNFGLAEDAILVLGDVTQIRQVIMNLLTNGSDAIGVTSGMITIRTGLQIATADYLEGTLLPQNVSAGTYGYLEVSDTGSGIDASDLEFIFDPFFTTKASGHGLGLAAVIGIVRAHGGTMQVYSEAGNGTTFKVLLPLSEESVDPDQPGSLFRAPQGEHILVVDDEDHVQAVTVMMLESYGFTTSRCSDGREAVAYYQEHGDAIDLVLIDVTMPHMDGITAFRKIQSINPNVRAILMSGYNEQQATNTLIGRAKLSFIQKPFIVDDLLSCITRVLDEDGD
ncbi:MAG: response regulator [Pseudomonadota bacterium]